MAIGTESSCIRLRVFPPDSIRQSPSGEAFRAEHGGAPLNRGGEWGSAKPLGPRCPFRPQRDAKNRSVWRSPLEDSFQPQTPSGLKAFFLFGRGPTRGCPVLVNLSPKAPNGEFCRTSSMMQSVCFLVVFLRTRFVEKMSLSYADQLG